MAAALQHLPARRPRGRPRGEEAKAAILQAAFAVLERDGFAAMTMEGVAAEAGAAKTTIYRWWPTRETLAMAAFLAATAPRIVFPETRSAEADIRAQMNKLARVYAGKTGRMLRGIVAAGDADAAASQAFVEGYIRPRRQAARVVFERGVASGEFRPDLDAEAVIDALYGPLFYRLLVGHAPLEPRWVDALAAVVFGGCRSGVTPSGLEPPAISPSPRLPTSPRSGSAATRRSPRPPARRQ